MALQFLNVTSQLRNLEHAMVGVHVNVEGLCRQMLDKVDIEYVANIKSKVYSKLARMQARPSRSAHVLHSPVVKDEGWEKTVQQTPRFERV